MYPADPMMVPDRADRAVAAESPADWAVRAALVRPVRPVREADASSLRGAASWGKAASVGSVETTASEVDLAVAAMTLNDWVLQVPVMTASNQGFFRG